jgi:V8-like Glu-specific endopeptidase
VEAAADAEDAQQIVTAPAAADREPRVHPTAEDIANAQEMPWPAAAPTVNDGQMVGHGGESGAMPGGLGDADTRAAFIAEHADAAALDAGPPFDAAAYGGTDDATYTVNRLYQYPPPFTRYFANRYAQMWQEYPWRTIGKLYFQVPGSSSWYSCTASVAYNRALWTAGHCVYTPGSGWHRNLTFAPAYKNGNAPYGWWDIRNANIASLQGWTVNGNQAYDIGMAVTQPRSGTRIAQVTGWLGFKYGKSTQQFWHANGYPGGIGNGNLLIVCEGSLSSRWVLAGPDPLGMGCDMQWGSSGGPWLQRFQPYKAGRYNYVNSVVSGSPDPNFSKEFFGPYFGSGALNLYNWGKSFS